MNKIRVILSLDSDRMKKIWCYLTGLIFIGDPLFTWLPVMEYSPFFIVWHLIEIICFFALYRCRNGTRLLSWMIILKSLQVIVVQSLKCAHLFIARSGLIFFEPVILLIYSLWLVLSLLIRRLNYGVVS